MAQDIVDDLYDNLKEDGWVENSREHFREFFLAPGEQGYRNRKALYDNMKEDGYVDSPTYEEFARRMGLGPVKKDESTKQSTARAATEGAAASGGNRTAAEGAGTRRPADAEQPAQGESTQAQQGGWRPTPIQKAFAMGDISNRVNSTIQSLQRGREAIRRVVKAQTPKGRSATKAAEMTARMAGTPTKVLGVSSYSTGDDATDAPAGGRLSPTVHGVKIEDGEAKTEWMLPDGTLTTSIVDADKAEYGARQTRLRHQFENRMKQNGLDPTKKEDVEEQTKRDVLDRAEKSVDIRLAENEKNLRETYDKRAEELDREMEWRDSEGFWDNFTRIVGGSVNRSVSNRAPKPVDTRSQHERTAGAYMAERQVLNEAKNLLETRSLKKSHGFMGGFWNVANNWRNFKMGAWHTATDLDFQTGYLMSAEKAGQLLEIEDKLKSGADLTDAEVSLVYSTMLGNEVEANTEIPHGYTAAKITVEMFPFMAQMMLNPASGLSRALVTKFGKSGLRKIAVRKAAQELTGEAAKRFAKRETRKLAAKAVGVQVAGDLAEATVLANTLQLPRTAADITERYVGNPIEDEKGNIIFDGNHNWAEAIYKGEASMIIENYTEMLGEHFGVMGKFIGKGAGKGLRAIGAGKVVDTVSDMITKFRISDFGKALGKLESRAHWNGAPLEVLEEEAGIVLNSIFTGDEKISDLWDADKQIDIILGVGLFGGFVSGIKTAGYPVAKARAKSRLRKRDGIGSFRFGDRWAGMREAMEQADERDLGTVVRDLTRAEAKSQEQARAITEYAQALMSARGYEIASASARAEGRVAPEQQDVEESYEHGSQIVENGDTQAMGDVRAEMERARRKFVSSTSEDFVADHFDGPDAVSNLSKLGDDAELRQAAADYVNAKAVYDGMSERIGDDIDSRIAQSDAEIDSRVNRQTGQIQSGIALDPETGEEREVYIIDGTVTMLASGAGIDKANSSESIIVRDAETGKVRFAAPSEFVSAKIGIDAEAQKEVARTQIREEMSRTAEDEMAGKLAFTPGDEYSILNLDGSEMQVQVIGPSADVEGNPVAGHVDIMYDGRVARVSTAVLQRWVDDARKARAEEYARERAEEEGGTETGPDNQDNGLDNPNRRTDLMPDDYQTPYDELPVRAARYIESERGTGGTLYRDENGNDAVVIAAIDDDNYVGYFREYDDAGNPTNRWSAKFQNGSGEKENYRDMMRTAGALLPAGHELTEHTSVSTDGLRNLANQLKHGYELQYDEQGNIVTTEVAVNMMAKENALGLGHYIPGSEGIIRADLTAEEQAEVKRRLTPYLEALWLSEGNCRWRDNTLYVDHPILKKADPAESEPVPPVSIRYDRGDSFRVTVSGREETQQAAVVDREGGTVTIWTPFPVTDKSEKGRTMSGYTTDIARADLDAIIVRDEQGKPVDYVAANPEVEENMEGEHAGIENNSVNLQHGNGSEQDNDERTEPREADGGRVASDAAGTVEADRDRSDIRVYEEGLASSRDAHSGDSERNRREAESERLVRIAKANGQYFDRDRKQEFGEKQLKATGESEVFIDRASDRVYKVKDPYAKSPMKGNVQPEDAIYEHLVHNKYFPETRYRFEGISEDLGEARIVLSQGYIESVGRPTQEQIEAALAEKGLYPDGKYTYGNDEISVTDVTGDNALLGIDGKVYFIDPIINFKKPVREIIGEYAQASNPPETVPNSGETPLATYTDRKGTKSDLFIDLDTTDKDGVRKVTFKRNVTKVDGTHKEGILGSLLITDEMIDWERTVNGVDANGHPRSTEVDPEEIERMHDAWSNAVTGARQDFRAKELRMKGDVIVAESMEGVTIFLKRDPLTTSTIETTTGTVQETPAPTAEPTPLQRLPRDAKGEPVFEQAENPEHGWDALVEFAEGDAAIAKEIADTMAEEKRKAYEKAQKQKPKGKTPTEILASKKAISAGLAQAEQEYNLWQQMANVEQRRQDAMRALQDAEARRLAAERAEAEKAERAEREESGGQGEGDTRQPADNTPTDNTLPEAEVRDWKQDRPEDARQRGYWMVDGQRVERQPELPMPSGARTAVKFDRKNVVEGANTVIEADRLQPSHLDGSWNPRFMLPEAQPKKEFNGARMVAATRIASEMTPEEITGGVTAYTGAPVVNRRGESIQGTGRGNALRIMWEQYPEQAAAYKAHLMELARAGKIDKTPEEIEAMRAPVNVRMLDVDDAEAIRLGNISVDNTESGGRKRMEPHATAAALTANSKTGEFVRRLFEGTDEDMSLVECIRERGYEVVQWLQDTGVINETQYTTAVTSQKNREVGLTDEAAADLRAIVEQTFFGGGPEGLREQWRALPDKAQKAILATSYKDLSSAEENRIINELHQSVAAYSELSAYPAFKDARNVKEALRAVDGWASSMSITEDGGMLQNREKYSNLALHLAALYRGESQKAIRDHFNRLYELIQGTHVLGLEDMMEGRTEADFASRSLTEAVKDVFGIDYEPTRRRIDEKDSKQDGRVPLAGGGETGTRGSGMGRGGVEAGERGAEGRGESERGAGASDDSRGVGTDKRGGKSEAEAPQTKLSKEDATDIIAKMEMSAVNDPQISLSPESWQNSFGLSNSIDTPLGKVKMGEGQYQKLVDKKRSAEFGMVVQTLQDPDVVFIEPSEAKEGQTTERDFSYVFVKTFIRNGQKFKYYTSVSVLKDGMEVSVSSHIASKTAIMKKLQGMERAYTKQSLLPNSSEWHLAEHPTDVPDLLPTQGKSDANLETSEKTVSERKVNNSASEKQGKGEESSDETSAAASAQSGTSAAAPARKGSAGGDSARRRVPEGMGHEEFDESVRGWKKNLTEASDEELREIVDKWERIFDDEDIDRYAATYVKTVAAEELLEERRSASSGRGTEEAGEAPGSGRTDGGTIGARIAAAEAEVNTSPTPAQAEAGNYKKGHVEIDGLKISIENPKGSKRRGQDPDGTPWETEMKNTYGYIKGTTGVDGDKIDIFLSDNPTDGDVYVVDQYNKDGSFDEHKVMYGFTSATEAEAAYLSNYSADWAKGRKVVVTGVTREEFNKWLDASARKKKPFAEYKSVKTIEAQSATAPDEAQAEPAEATEGYELDVYETRKGKKFHRVKFPRADKEVWKERLDIAKEQFGGTSVPGGYGFKDAETAKTFAEAILHPVSAEGLKDRTDAMESSEISSAAASARDEGKNGEAREESAGNEARSRWFNEEDQDEAADLIRKMKARLKGGSLYGGVPIDVELLELGCRLGYLIMKKGARKLHEYAQAMIENVGDGIRPYIKQFYNATLATEEALAGEWYKDSTPMAEIAKFDMVNFLKEQKSDIVEKARGITAEQEVQGAMPQAATDMVKKSRDKMAIPGYFKPDGSVSAEKKAAEAGADLAANLVDELGLDQKNLPEGVQLITTDFKESEGSIRINLPIRAGYEPIKIDIDFDKTEEGALRLRELTTTMKRGDDLSYIIGEDHKAWLAAPGHKELLNAIRGQIKDYLPKEGKKQAAQASLFDEAEAPAAPAAPEPQAKTGDKLLMQYETMKKKHPDAVVLFRVGDFYETFRDDARIISETLGLTLTSRGVDKTPLAGFPHHALDAYLPKLVRAGKRVAICEQLEEPKISKQTVKRGTTPQPATEPKAPATSQAEFDELSKKEFEVDPKVEKEIIADRNGFKIGDTVEWSIPGQGKTSATIIDVDRDGRPILDTGMAPIISSIAEWKDLTRKTGEGSPAPAPQRPKSELAGDSAKEQERRNAEHDFVEAVSNELIQRINNEGSPLTMAEVRKMAEARGMKDITPTDLQELVERAVSLRARSIAEHTLTGGPGTQEIGFNKIVKLYTTQPVLSDRDVERIQRQQYSTPVPMGYVMDQFMMSHGHNGKRLLEPSAGNGALTIGVPKDNCHVNDIDPRRLANLRAMGFKVITNQDGLLPFEGRYDMVVTNPPFGTAPSPRTYDGLFEITTLEGQMAINALESMTDDGRAAIIVGGSIGKWPTPYEKNGRLKKVADRQFFGYLYSHYNVVDIIPIDGKSLYSRNGTGYNVRMILIDGRRRDAEGNVIREINAENRVYPPVREEARPEAVTTYDELYKRVQDDILRIQQRLDVADGNDGSHIEGDRADYPSDTSLADRAGSRDGERPVGTGDSGRTPRSGLGGDATRSTGAQGGIHGRSGRDRGVGGQTDADAGSGNGSALDERTGTGRRQTELRAVEHVDGSGDRGGIRHGATDADGGSQRDNADGARQRSGSGPVRLNQPKPVKVELTDEKVASPHISSAGNLMSRMPAAQAQEFERALHELEEKHGNVDEWLTQELGYADTADLYRALAAEQVEGVAMAIDKMNSGRGFIIADQTGIGKGRQAASIIRYAVRNGHKPIFFTQKAGLFSDMYRDLKDIGSPELKPFIFGSDKDEASITERQDDGTDKVIYPLPKPKERDRVLSYIERHGTLPDEYDYAVITYSQVQSGTTQYEIGNNGKIEAKPKTKKGKGASSGEINGERRRNAIGILSRDNYLILDEAHTAGGQSGLGGYMQSIIPGVKGITYLSATYAKRPDNMPLYAIKTAISDSGVEVAELISAVAQGGVPLQEIMSRQLVKSGEMARRERDFTGVTIDWIPSDEGVARGQQKRFDTVSEIFVDIMRFQDTYVRPYLSEMSKDLARIGSSSGQKKGTKDMGIANAPFASKLYNLLQQLLFSIKVDAVADRAIRNLQQGRKPIISFVNTMEGFLEDASMGMTAEGSASMPTLSLALRKALDGVMRYTVKDDNNKETHSELGVSQLGSDAESAYNAIIEKMNAVSDDLPIAPLDAIRMKIEAAGYKVGELSGRKLELAKNDKGLYVIRNRKAADKKATASDFNAGKIDVLMVNKTGSTGISLHASSKFEDQRQRVMIAAQFQPDVNDEVQMRGRNDRTGQIVRGAYEYLLSSIPAEQRLQMMFKAKLKSLDANTTSSQKSSFNEMEVVDVLNKYGDAIVWDYLNEDPLGLNMDMGNPLGIDPTEDIEAQQKAPKKKSNKNDEDDGSHSGFARKALGRLALLPIAKQERVMSEITERYEKKIHELDERGENDLEISYRDLKAKTLGRKVWVEGKDPDSGNAFTDNVYMEQVEVNILDKPLSGTELAKYHRTFLEDAGVETWDEWIEKKTAEIDAFYENRIATVSERITANKEATIARRIERFITTAKDARALGKNSFTDEEITAEANRRYGETERQEAKAEIERETEKIRIQQNLIKRRLTQFKPMSPLSIPDDLTDESIMNLEPSTGVMVGIKLDSKYSLNGSQVVFAPLDGRRTITLSLKEAGVAFSKIGQASMMMRDLLRNFDLSQWDSHISNESRETRYMLTGNILRALVDMQKTQNARGRITAYTTEDGEVRTGVLMSPKFTPGDLQTSAPLSSMLSRIQTGQEVKSSNGEVTVRKTQSWSSRGDYEILVPKSKKRGGKYFLPEQDPVLARYVVGGFEMPRSGSQAIGYIRAENLARVLDHLSTKHGASVMLTSVLREASQDNIEYRTPEEGVEYVNARAIQPWSARLDELRFKRDELGGTMPLWERQEVRELGAQEKVWEEKWAAEHTDTDVPTGRRSRFEFYADQYGQGGLSAEMSHARSESGPLRSAEGRLISANARDMARRALSIIARRRAELLAERPTYSRAGQAAIDAELADLEYMALYYQRMEAGEDVERTMPGRLEHQRMLATAREVAESLGEKVVLYEAPGDIHDTDYNRQVRKQRSYGWYNPNDGTIHINVGRHKNAREIVKTALHEIVGHKTIEQIMGPKRFARLIDEIWEHAGKKVRAKIAEKMRKNGWDYREATKEYLAELAEEVHTKGFETLETEKRTIWQRVKAKIEDFLNRILEGMKIPARVRLTENDLSYMMWKVYKHKRRKAARVSSASASARYEREGDIFDKAEEIARREEWERDGNSLEIAAHEGGDNKTMAERAREVMEQEAIEIAPHDYSREELKRLYSTLPSVEKDGRQVHFYHSAFGKNYRPDGNFAKVIPQLDQLLEAAKFAYSTADELGGHERRDGSMHKAHPNLDSYDNYVAKAKIGEDEYYVRITVQNEQRGSRSGVHSSMVTNVALYENPAALNSLPIIHGGAVNYDRITDAKLREFFESAKKYPDYVKDLLPSDMGNANTEYRVRENQARTFDPETGLHFRDGDFTARDRVTAADVYERMLSRGSWQFREAMQDSMLGLKTLYESILGKGSRIEDVAAYENAYLYENRMSSANNAEQYEYFSRYMKPLLGAIHDLCGSDAVERRELTDYMMAKHGLERNAYMRAEAAAAGEETERDFAGLCGLTGEVDWQEAERVAREMADIYEMTHDPGLVDELWDRTRAATGATLEKIYTSGLISEETYGKVSGMYENYVPLRGWDETTSDEVYGYLTSNDGPLLGNVFKHAEGRESKADDPIATIAKMADDAIRQGNRNVMKQRFLNFVQGHPSDLVSVSDLWLERDAVTGEWKPVFADLEADMTHAEIEAELAKFEARMEMLSAAEPENYKHGREARHIPYKVVRGNEREHQILVKRDGRTKVITINGNPRAAQALNGLSNPDVEAGSFVGKLLKAGEWTNRQLSAFYTTRNPDFVVSNFMRDMLYSNTMTWVKETPAYALRYHRNFGRLNPARMHILLRKWENGSLSDANPQERMFREFMRNGGETGYTSVKDIEGHKRAVAAELKKQGSVGRRAWAALGMQLDLLNRSVENCARFAAYVTSREFGRGIDRSIYDAKEISVNFNKKGSGGKFLDTTGQKWLGKVGAHLGGWGRVLYVFWNAGLQGLTNFGRAAKRHPGKALAGAAALFGLGVVIPLLAQMAGGDDDDKNAYYNLPEYIRRSNICFRAGEQWIVIPLPIEYRALYGLGELSTGVISGNERYGDGELGLQMAAQVSQILPLDMLEGGGGLSPLLPSMVKPGVEAYVMNKGWTGLPIYKDTPFNKNDPEWTKAYRSADQHLVGFARWLNETTGGDDYKKGAIDINPAKVEYLLSGMFGGFVSFPMKIKKSGEMLAGDREFEWRNIPLANRIVKSGDERTASRRLQNEYFRLKEEAEETGRLARKYRSAVKDGRSEYAVKVNDLVGTEEYLRYEIYKMYEPDLKVLRERQKSETNTKMQESTEAELNSVMRETVEAMRAPERHKEEVRVNMRLEAYETEWSETGKRLEALRDMPGDAVAKAAKARAINESPEGERYWLYKDLHPYLGQIRKSRRQAETREEREAETATETTLKRDLVEMLDSWNNPERRNAARKRAQETFDAWKRRDSKHIKQ